MRLDIKVVELGLAPNRSRAAALIRDGHIQIDGVVDRRPGRKTFGGRVTSTAPDHVWVSRAAWKLLHALERFGLEPRGQAMDLGASTGGFTEVLLARGAAQVYALDVGHGQLHERLRDDPRVTNLERTNARTLTSDDLPAIDWFTADLSFISLLKAINQPLKLSAGDATLVALIKPQFEAGPAHVGKGGIVRDPRVHARCRRDVADGLRALGWRIIGVCESPIRGSDGNREYLIAATRT